MSSRITSTLVLIVSRGLNFSLRILSPVLLVRFLTVEQYGKYREFLLYSMLISVMFSFAIPRSLLYFIPKYRNEQNNYIAGASVLLFVSSVIGILLFYGFHRTLFNSANIDLFLPQILIFTFLYINFRLLEPYWLGNKKPKNVLLYSSCLTAIRMVSLLVVAALFHSVEMIVCVVLVVEGARFVYALFFLGSKGLFRARITIPTLKNQMGYILPLGVTAMINTWNNQVSNVVVSLFLGTQALAIYAIGSYQFPFSSIIRTSVNDVIFPQMVEQETTEVKDKLALWKKANLIFCFFTFPLFAVFMTYADVFVEVMFTAKYLDAVPLFRVYLFFFLLECVELTMPLRAINKNKYILVANVARFGLNIGLIYLLYPHLGIMAPAVAFVAAEVLSRLILSWVVMTHYRIGISDLYLWPKVFRVAMCCGIAQVVLLGARIFLGGRLDVALISSVLFGVIYCSLVYWSGVDEVRGVYRYAKDKAGKLAFWKSS